MEVQIRKWILGFTFHHRCNFLIFHEVRAPFTSVKNDTLGGHLLNFRQFLKMWAADSQPKCVCHRFPQHIQTRARKTAHMSAFASECFPQDQMLTAHLDDEIPPTWKTFLHHNTEQFEQWLKRWKLRRNLIQYWQAFFAGIMDPSELG